MTLAKMMIDIILQATPQMDLRFLKVRVQTNISILRVQEHTSVIQFLDFTPPKFD